MVIDVEAKDIRWSEHDQKAYTCEYKGYTFGIGAHPGIPNIAIWNLVWLLTPAEILDRFLKKNNPEELAMSTTMLPYIIGTAWQFLDDKNLVANAAAKLTPMDFIKLVSDAPKYKNLILTEFFPDWLDLAKVKAEIFSSRQPANVVQVNFGGKR